MGFDINIMMMLFMCPVKGKPYYFRKNKETYVIDKCYELPTLDIPPKMHMYLEGRGHHFHAYTHRFDELEMYDASAEEFLAWYPSWEQIEESVYYRDGIDAWFEEDHNEFKKLLEWCCEQEVSFRLCWSY